MKRLFKILAKVVALAFEVLMVYLFLLMISLGFPLWLWAGVIFGIILIGINLAEIIGLIGQDEKEMEDKLSPPLYYNLKQLEDGHWIFIVYAQNHEEICRSDDYTTHDGALTGLWYLMEAMKRMDYLTWETKASN